jgi:hypothetical protein
MEGTPIDEIENILMEDVDKTQMNPFVWYDIFIPFKCLLIKYLRYLFWRTCDEIFATKGLYPGEDPKATKEQLKKDADELYEKTKAFVQKKYP